MHTIDAAETIGRMVEFFPSDKQPMIRSILAGVLRGVVSQRLLPRKGGGRIAAVEVMVTNERIADLIRDAQPEEIPYAIEEGSFYEMQTLSRALIDLVLAGMVDREPRGRRRAEQARLHDRPHPGREEPARPEPSTRPRRSPARPSPMEPRSANDEEEAPPLRLLSEAG